MEILFIPLAFATALTFCYLPKFQIVGHSSMFHQRNFSRFPKQISENLNPQNEAERKILFFSFKIFGKLFFKILK